MLTNIEFISVNWYCFKKYFVHSYNINELNQVNLYFYIVLPLDTKREGPFNLTLLLTHILKLL
jgi:hypothetical protein